MNKTPFKRVIVSVDANGYRTITWYLQPRLVLPANSTLSVEYSGSGGDIWQVLQDGITDQCSYQDTVRRSTGKFNDQHYRVRLTISPTQQYVSNPSASGKYFVFPQSGKAKNMVRLLSKEIDISGRPGVLLKKKTWGTPCPQCIELPNQSSVNEHCPVCLGTSIVGGYFPGISLTILQTGRTESDDVSPMGLLQTITLSARCVAWPFISLGDMWVDAQTNDRFFIQQAAVASSFRSVPILYNLRLGRLQATDVLYSQDVNALVAPQNGSTFVSPGSTAWQGGFQSI